MSDERTITPCFEPLDWRTAGRRSAKTNLAHTVLRSDLRDTFVISFDPPPPSPCPRCHRTACPNNARVIVGLRNYIAAVAECERAARKA